MKINEFKSILNKKNCNLALFYNSDSTRISPNMFYFSGYDGLGTLVIPRKQVPFLIVPEMEIERARRSMIKKVYSMDRKKFFESIYKIIRKKKSRIKNIAIDKNNFTLNSYKNFKKYFRKVKTKDISLDCAKLREIKIDKEIRLLKI